MYEISFLILSIISFVLAYTLDINCLNENSWFIDINYHLFGLGNIYIIIFVLFKFFKPTSEYESIDIVSYNCFNINIIILFMLDFVWFVSGLFILFNSNYNCIYDNIIILLFYLFQFISLIFLFKNSEKLI